MRNQKIHSNAPNQKLLVQRFVCTSLFVVPKNVVIKNLCIFLDVYSNPTPVVEHLILPKEPSQVAL